MTGQELKSLIFDRKERFLCDNCKYRYCPTYDCALLDKAKALTDRQWNNIAKEVANEFDLCVLPHKIMKKRKIAFVYSPRMAGKQH